MSGPWKEHNGLRVFTVMYIINTCDYIVEAVGIYKYISIARINQTDKIVSWEQIKTFARNYIMHISIGMECVVHISSSVHFKKDCRLIHVFINKIMFYVNEKCEMKYLDIRRITEEVKKEILHNKISCAVLQMGNISSIVQVNMTI